MAIKKLLIANRGEIAIRIAAAAHELGIFTTSVYAQDDASSLHRFRSDQSIALAGSGPAAYLDGEQITRLAAETNCDAVHPGYGFLSENQAFAHQCQEAGLKFVGPDPETLGLFADKSRARILADKCGVPIIAGTKGDITLDDAHAFFGALRPNGAMIIKAVAGGGGRGMRIVTAAADIDSAYQQCRTEAEQAFDDGSLFAEQFLAQARHVEVQIVSDGDGDVVHLGERECSLQRRHQKIIEFAPCPHMTQPLRHRITAAAVSLAKTAGYENIGTIEFLIDGDQMRSNPDDADFYFLEANPRIQVEHTVTEEVMGVDLAKIQLMIAAGRTLQDLELHQGRFESAHGHALQARINMERMEVDGRATPTAGKSIGVYEMPSGRGVRVDGCGYVEYTTNPRYDSLIAKLVVHSDQQDFNALLKMARRTLSECRIEGVETNIPFLRAVLARDEIGIGSVHTRFVDEHAAALVDAARQYQAPLVPSVSSDLGVLSTGQIQPPPTMLGELPPGSIYVGAPMQGMIVDVHVDDGATVSEGELLATLEAMKMLHDITAPQSGVIRRIGVRPDQIVESDQNIMILEVTQSAIGANDQAEVEIDLDEIRPDLTAILERKELGLDPARPTAVEKRRKTNQRTARENIEDLCDDGSFVEYGALAIASQRRRRSVDDLIRNTPADGLVMGVGNVNGSLLGDASSKCAVLAYDYTVLAGTQGYQNHQKKDRMFQLAERRQLPVVLFSEGGGGRPGDLDILAVTGLDVASFSLLAKLSGLVPLVGINSGRCFAGNAALLGCCDVIIATKNSSIGMGGPALIEGGGLGVYQPDEIGPMSVQVPNGVVDIAVEDEVEAVAVAKKYLSYFQGSVTDWTAPDQRLLRRAIPENRVRAYDIRRLISYLADSDSVLEVRPEYGHGIVTAFIRIAGRPLGVLANNSMHLGGAIDGPAADTASRFMQLCDAHDIPILSLCDTPGFMVGPETEKTAVVRRFARMFVTAASVTTPVLAVVLRKAYGLGAMAMMAGQAQVPDFLVSWPSGEFGGMGLEGAIKLGLRKEIEAIEDPEEREAYYREQVAAAYEFGKAANAAAQFEIDDVIDPAETRRWILSALSSVGERPRKEGKKRNQVDTW